MRYSKKWYQWWQRKKGRSAWRYFSGTYNVWQPISMRMASFSRPHGQKRIPWVFDFLEELFDQVFLFTNVGKMVSISCHTYRCIGGHSVDAYGILMVGEVLTHRE